MAHQTYIKFFRGAEAGIPVLDDGEPGFTTDSHKLFIGEGGVNYPIGGGTGTVTEIALGTGGGLILNPDPIVDTGTIEIDWGTGTNQVRHGDDAAYTDARTPLAHAPSHNIESSDPYALADNLDTLGGITGSF